MRRNILVVTTILCAVSTHADFNYTDFSSTAGLNLVGIASQAGNRIHMTVASNQVKGAVYSQVKQRVNAGFQSRFQFQINGTADGFAFLVQNESATSLYDSGGTLGYGYDDFQRGGIKNSIATEFDILQNGGSVGAGPDPSGNHVGVHTRGLLANSANMAFSIGDTTGIPNMKDGSIHTVLMSYTPGSLSMTMDNAAHPQLTVAVNLDTLLSLDAGTAWVGFTASTGAQVAQQDLLNWSFHAVPEPSQIALVLVFGGLAWRRKRN